MAPSFWWRPFYILSSAVSAKSWALCETRREAANRAELDPTARRALLCAILKSDPQNGRHDSGAGNS